MVIEWFHILLLMNILGACWSVYREVYIAILTKRITKTGAQMLLVIHRASVALSSLSRSIDGDRKESSEARNQARESLRQAEERLSMLIREANRMPIVIHNMNSGGDNSTIAQGQEVSQQRTSGNE